MDSMGCRYSVAGGVIKVTHSCIVLMRGERCSGLYRLVGSTINKNSIGGCIWSVQQKGYPKCVSFTMEAKKWMRGFQGADECEGKITAGGRGGGSRPRFGVNG